MYKEEIIGASIVVGIFLLIVGCAVYSIKGAESKQEADMKNLYSAWCVMYNKNGPTITYEQWHALYLHRLLPEQKLEDKNKSDGTKEALIGAAIGYGAAKLTK